MVQMVKKLLKEDVYTDFGITEIHQGTVLLIVEIVIVALNCLYVVRYMFFLHFTLSVY